ncbi:HPP family protein [Candidatus Latescibacterota bacterium]
MSRRLPEASPQGKRVRRRRPAAPQGSLLFRVVAALSRMQISYLIRNARHPAALVAVFAMVSGASALALITLAAQVLDLPLLFPPLGPTAFILFYTPMAATASPRNTIQAHFMAVCAGLASLWAVNHAFPAADLADPATMNGYRVAAITLAMVLISIAMMSTRSIHPPAAASALIAAMGYLRGPTQILGLPAAVVFLVFLAVVLNRVVGGLPYPLWRADPGASRLYGLLAGNPQSGTFWGQLNRQLHQRRD